LRFRNEAKLDAESVTGTKARAEAAAELANAGAEMVALKAEQQASATPSLPVEAVENQAPEEAASLPTSDPADDDLRQSLVLDEKDAAEMEAVYPAIKDYRASNYGAPVTRAMVIEEAAKGLKDADKTNRVYAALDVLNGLDAMRRGDSTRVREAVAKLPADDARVKNHKVLSKHLSTFTQSKIATQANEVLATLTPEEMEQQFPASMLKDDTVSPKQREDMLKVLDYISQANPTAVSKETYDIAMDQLGPVEGQSPATAERRKRLGAAARIFATLEKLDAQKAKIWAQPGANPPKTKDEVRDEIYRTGFNTFMKGKQVTSLSLPGHFARVNDAMRVGHRDEALKAATDLRNFALSQANKAAAFSKSAALGKGKEHKVPFVAKGVYGFYAKDAEDGVWVDLNNPNSVALAQEVHADATAAADLLKQLIQTHGLTEVKPVSVPGMHRKLILRGDLAKPVPNTPKTEEPTEPKADPELDPLIDALDAKVAERKAERAAQTKTAKEVADAKAAEKVASKEAKAKEREEKRLAREAEKKAKAAARQKTKAAIAAKPAPATDQAKAAVDAATSILKTHLDAVGVPVSKNLSIEAFNELEGNLAAHANVQDGAATIRISPRRSEDLAGGTPSEQTTHIVLHEWGHVLDFLYGDAVGLPFSRGNDFKVGGRIHKEVQALAAKDAEWGKFWSYALDETREAGHIPKELFAELVALYLQRPDVMREELPIGYAKIELAFRVAFEGKFKPQPKQETSRDNSQEPEAGPGRNVSEPAAGNDNAGGLGSTGRGDRGNIGERIATLQEGENAPVVGWFDYLKSALVSMRDGVNVFLDAFKPRKDGALTPLIEDPYEFFEEALKYDGSLTDRQKEAMTNVLSVNYTEFAEALEAAAQAEIEKWKGKGGDFRDFLRTRKDLPLNFLTEGQEPHLVEPVKVAAFVATYEWMLSAAGAQRPRDMEAMTQLLGVTRGSKLPKESVAVLRTGYSQQTALEQISTSMMTLLDVSPRDEQTVRETQGLFRAPVDLRVLSQAA
jgi:hypothetical protein